MDKNLRKNNEKGSGLKNFWTVFSFPGYIFLLIIYYFPTEWGKDRNTATSARQLRAKNFFAPFWSIIIYMVIIFFLIAIFADE